jgi:DNA-binding transcriptional ArsR family regulator
MREGPDIAALAALIGDPARANILTALMAGMALTAGELAREADVSAPTASAHLAKLREAGLIVMEVQGRHRYFRLAGAHVAEALEGLMELAARTGRLRTRPGPRDAAMRFARVCYDHLAGAMGVRALEALVGRGIVVATADGLGLSSAGRERFRAKGGRSAAPASIGASAGTISPAPPARRCCSSSSRADGRGVTPGAAPSPSARRGSRPSRPSSQERNRRCGAPGRRARPCRSG